MKGNNTVVLRNTHETIQDRGIMCGGVICKSLLKYPFLNYVKVEKEGKGCFELRWNTRVYRSDCFGLNEWLEEGGDYGVQTNNSFIEINGVMRQLLVIDWDNQKFQNKVINKFPETFTTTSGSPKNCVHSWFATDKHEKKFAVGDEEGNCLADIFGQHGQVLAPGSKHKSGSVYSIVNDVPIAFIPYDEVLEILKPYMKKETKKVVAVAPKQSYGNNSFYNMVRSKLDVIDVLNKLGIDTQRPRTDCPLHSSEGHECLHFDKDKWYCHHNACKKSGNLFTLVKLAYKLDTRETFEKLAELTGLQDELLEYQIEYNKKGGNN